MPTKEVIQVNLAAANPNLSPTGDGTQKTWSWLVIVSEDYRARGSEKGRGRALYERIKAKG